MPAEDTSKKGSATPKKPDESPPDAAPPDAILRNLASLMSQESDKKGSFKSRKSALPGLDNTASADDLDRRNEAKSEELEKIKDASAAAELRRTRRLKSSPHPTSLSEDAEIDVIFDEDNPSGPTPTSDQADASLQSEPTDPASPAEQLPDNGGRKKLIQGRFTKLELASVGLLLIALLCSAFMFAYPIRKAFAEYRLAAAPQLDIPPQFIAGQFVQLKEVDSYWRNRKQNDRVQEGSTILPVINIGAVEGTGSLQIIFRDEIGRIRGDTHVFRIEPGETIHALGTSGMLGEVQFSDHRISAESQSNEHWTITIKESDGEQEWILIGQYRLSSDRR